MIYADSIDEKKKAILSRAEWLRLAAAQIKKIKPVINDFDGKIYNCRFDEAIKNLSDDRLSFWTSNQYGSFEIVIYHDHTYSDKISLLTGYSCKVQKNDYSQYHTDETRAIFDGKRINADKIAALLDASYARLNKEAYELEVIAGELEDRIKQIADTYNLLNHLCGSLPTVVSDICNIKRHYY